MRLYRDRPSGTVDRARELRRAASPVEKHLLRGLKAALPQLKWRHQVPIGPFYADILCFSERVVIEVDGAEHATATAYDTDRTRFVQSKGYRVLRFWNNDVMENLDGVLTQVSLSLREREGAHAKHGKGEGDYTNEIQSPSPFRGCAAPSLSQGERE